MVYQAIYSPLLQTFQTASQADDRHFKVGSISMFVYFKDFRLKVSLLFIICFLMRLCFAGRYLDCHDSIDFAFGLQDYNLSLHQPHFPGYPVYIFTSWLFFKIFHNEVLALVIPGVLFGSLTVYPLSFLARKLFSERAAILACILYLVNPLCWLQAERPTSDAMGLFFIIMSACFLYDVYHEAYKGSFTVHLNSTPFFSKTKISNALSSAKLFVHAEAPKERGIKLSQTPNRLFLGSLVLGIGLGIRLSYFPFIILWTGILFHLAIKKIPFKLRYITYGLSGLIIGICSWLLPQIIYVGWHHFWQSCFAFSYGHFIDWGGSIVTFGGFERIICLMKSVWVYGLGGWWFDTTLFRIIPSSVMLVAIPYSFKRHLLWYQRWFLGLYVIPYMLWIIIGQNAANPRHMIPVIPIVLMLISYGLCKIYEKTKITAFCVQVITLLFVAVLSVTSSVLVIQYHNTIPASIQIMQFIKRQFDTTSTSIYCGEEKRVFDYYAPLWDVRSIRNVTDLNVDLQSSLWKPQNILVIHSSRDIKHFEIKHPPLKTFEGNPYIDGRGEKLLLHKLNVGQGFSLAPTPE